MRFAKIPATLACLALADSAIVAPRTAVAVLAHAEPSVLSGVACLKTSDYFALQITCAHIQNVVTRSNGQLLFSALDWPKLWSLNVTTKSVNGAVSLLSYPNTQGLTSIAEILPDNFVVASVNASDYSGEKPKLGVYSVWRVDFTEAGSPKRTLLTTVPEAGFISGIARFDDDAFFFADARHGVLYRMSMSTGEYRQVLADASMRVRNASDECEGIHGLKYNDGYRYFTNTDSGSLNKLPIDDTTAEVSGKPEVLSSGWQSPQDFIIDSKGSLYITSLGKGEVAKVTKNGTKTVIATVSKAVSCAFGRMDNDSHTLYIGTSLGIVYTLAVD